MKTIILSLFIGSLAMAGAKELTIKLDYPKDEKREKITTSLLEKFDKLLQKDGKLKTEFEKLQATAKENAGGRYILGSPQVLVIPRLEAVEFREKGNRTFHDTVILYYSFGEGFRGGFEVNNGTFAVFQIRGNIDYKAAKGDSYELVKAEVTAKFDGFQSSISAKHKEPE